MSLRFVACLALATAPSMIADARSPIRRVEVMQVGGIWDSTYGEVRLTQEGTRIFGQYPCCGGGTLEGSIQGAEIRFHWKEPRGAGEGEGVWRVRDGMLVGSWGHGRSDSDGATWKLWRPRAAKQIAQ